jgi:hypothetical protein
MDHCARPRWVRVAPLVLLALPVSGGTGCSSDRVPLHSVRGQILYNNRPVARAMVIFHPLGEYPEKLPRPIAYTDAEGRFRMTTDRPGDGVPAGEYAVTVELREKTRTGVEKVRGRNLLPDRYSKPESTKLRCRVQEGPNELPPMNLTDL